MIRVVGIVSACHKIVDYLKMVYYHVTLHNAMLLGSQNIFLHQLEPEMDYAIDNHITSKDDTNIVIYNSNSVIFIKLKHMVQLILKMYGEKQ